MLIKTSRISLFHSDVMYCVLLMLLYFSICFHPYSFLMQFYNLKFASMTNRLRALCSDPQSWRTWLKPENRSFQVGLHYPLTQDAKAKDTILDKFSSYIRCNNSAKIYFTSPEDENPLQAVCRCEETLQSYLMQVAIVGDQYQPNRIDESGQSPVPGDPMESTHNVHIGHLVSYADNNRNRDKMCVKKKIIQQFNVNQMT